MRSSEWLTSRVDELISQGILEINDGYRVKLKELSSQSTEFTVPFVRGGDIGQNGFIDTDVEDFLSINRIEAYSKKIAKPGDVAFITKGTVGRVGRITYNQPQVVFAPQVCFWRTLDENQLSSRYLYYLMVSDWFQLYLSSVKTSGAMVADYVSLRDQQHFELPIPPLDEQRRIAHVLGTLDDKIELNRQMNATLEAITQAIFKSWFVDFDGHDDLVESDEFGLIPRGWEVGSFTKWIKIDPRLKTLTGEVATYMGMSEMPTSGHRAENWYPREYTSGKRFQNNDTLMARITPCLENGKTAFVDFLEKDEVGWGSTEYLVMRTQSYLPPEYVYHLCRSEQVRAFAIANMTGTSGRQRVGKKDFKHLHIAVPPRDRAEEFGRLASTLMAKIRANDEVSRTLTELRDTLLPRLISGELRVPEALEIADEVAEENESEDEVKQLKLGL